MKRITVVGAGLAGSEAALIAASFGVRVFLYEMRPKKMTPAHTSGKPAELVCSNSLKAKDLYSAPGLLKEELKILGSFLIRFALECEIPGGKALTVDRWCFSQKVEDAIKNHPNIVYINEEVREIPDGIVVIASGPLTSEPLAEEISKLIGQDYLYFYDAQSPIVDGDSLNYDKLYFKDRFGYDDSAYLNAPMTEEEYRRFWEELIKAEIHEPKEFEREVCYFEACLPIEVMAKRGFETLLYGPLRPVGLDDPRTGKLPFAVVQLRREDAEGKAWNLVGFQTQLKISEQIRVFRLIPGLENAEFLRFGAVHRNTYINSPELLLPTLQLKKEPRILLAGQITGTEGYVPAIAGGHIAGLNAALLALGYEPVVVPRHTMLGALIEYITTPKKDFQPMNANFGIIPDVPKMKKDQRIRFIVERALREIENFAEKISSLK
ncbi:MAG: methylenetetrahydrofolate--tRNA-(uracil(54)-C(5))-methyltransferase (FADH(2)-oxidizing) TrmFO [Candidatus Caldipriscus sp.]|nr:methylenetetrahydrofolate--tRNA-(uracil(54)-C(5))-methyltransferase (FADH(2)-oxidizing) TrmFO [Candidatus Caldipriscus sp.]